MKILAKLRNRVILWVFNRYFGQMVYSFEKTDEQIKKLNDHQRQNYYEAIYTWVTSDGYKLEYEGEISQIYEELASKAQTEDVMTAYRLLLLKIKNKHLRLTQLAQNHAALQAFHLTQAKF